MDKFKKHINPKTIMASCILAFMLVMTIICAIIDLNSVSTAVKEFDSSNFDAIEDRLVLLSKVSNNVKASYISSDDKVVISHTNALITRPEFDDGDLDFKITVTFSKGFASKNVVYDAVVLKDDHDVKSMDELLVEQSEKVKLKNVIVAGKDKTGLYLTDGTKFVYLQQSTTALYNVGDTLEVRAFRRVVNNQVYLADAITITKTNTTSNTSYIAPSTVATIADAINLSTTTQYYPVNFTFKDVTLSYEVNDSVDEYFITDGVNKIQISSNTSTTNLNALKSFLLVKVDQADGTSLNTYPSQTVDITLMISNTITVDSNGNSSMNAVYLISQLKK